MHWFERKIRRYEHRRWTTDDNRRVQPFDWGLEHIGGDPGDPNPGEFVRNYAKHAIENSSEWFATTPATDYHIDSDNVADLASEGVEADAAVEPEEQAPQEQPAQEAPEAAIEQVDVVGEQAT